MYYRGRIGGAAELQIMLFSHICCPDYMTGAEKFLLFLIRELAGRHRCVLVVPQEGQLSAEARIELNFKFCPILPANFAFGL